MHFLFLLLLSSLALGKVYYPGNECYENGKPSTLKILFAKKLDYGRGCYLHLSCMANIYGIVFQFKCDKDPLIFQNKINDSSRFRINSISVVDDYLYFTIFDEEVTGKKPTSRLIRIRSRGAKEELLLKIDNGYLILENENNKLKVFDLVPEKCSKTSLKTVYWPGCYQKRAHNFIL